MRFQGYMIFIAEKCTRIALKKSHMVNKKNMLKLSSNKVFCSMSFSFLRRLETSANNTQQEFGIIIDMVHMPIGPGSN